MLQRRGFVSCAICSAIGLVATWSSAGAQSQPPGFSRKVLQKTEYPGDKYVCILVEVDIEPNALIARHTHPGVESGYLVSGSSTLSVKGQPDRVLKPGDGYQVPPETPHSVRNGPEKSIVSATFIVEKDKPLATPAPE
jgi:quercetin dioxygenase-like cupin family protein